MYEFSPAELAEWNDSYVTYMNDGTDKSGAKCISYLRKFMDEQYRASHVHELLDPGLTVEENLQILQTDQETRYPVLLRRLKLFLILQKYNKNISRSHLYITDTVQRMEASNL